ncbi:MAG: 3'-5' exonuclease [bacterium]|nr:3'-5' exonuclease [bacterium]
MKQRPGMSNDGETWTLKKFHGAIKVDQNYNGDLVAAYLDTETTGLDHRKESVIELGILIFKIDTDSGKITEILEDYSQFQDPGRPIPEVVVQLTGITDEMVCGQSIRWETVNQMLTTVDIIIAHNAKFDRGFIDPLVPISSERIWACSMSQVDWSGTGTSCRNLSHLCMEHGYFFDSHRAINDVKAGVQLLSFDSPKTGKPYLWELNQNCQQSELLVSAEGSPFSTKDILKAKGFRWNAPKKVWQKRINTAQKDEIQEFFDSEIYNRPGCGRFAEIPPKDRFKSD